MAEDLVWRVREPGFDALSAAFGAVRKEVRGLLADDQLIVGLRSRVHTRLLQPHDVADLGLRLSAVSDAAGRDGTVRAGIVRADCKCHVRHIKSLEEGFKDVRAFIGDHDCVTFLGQGRNDGSQPRPISFVVLVDKELSLDVEGHLSVNVIVAIAARSIGARLVES